jgi:hypothetical protein
MIESCNLTYYMKFRNRVHFPRSEVKSLCRPISSLEYPAAYNLERHLKCCSRCDLDIPTLCPTCLDHVRWIRDSIVLGDGIWELYLEFPIGFEAVSSVLIQLRFEEWEEQVKVPLTKRPYYWKRVTINLRS